MHIVHLVAGVPPGGGISESVPSLCRHLHMRGHRVTLATLDGERSEAACEAAHAGVHLLPFKLSMPKKLYFSWSMLRQLAPIVQEADIVHVHLNWTFPVWWGCHCARSAGIPLVFSPRGCLAPIRLQRSFVKKSLAGFFFDRRYLRAATCIHVTCEAEQQEVERYLQGKHPPIKVISNGLDMEKWQGPWGREVIDRYWPGCSEKRVVLFLGRLSPVKGLELLLEAWQLAMKNNPMWHLLILGPDENNYSSQLQKCLTRLGLDDCVTLGGPMYGNDKYAVVRGADLFVLPTYNENFGNAVVEALAAGVPVITTKGAPWSDLLGTEICGQETKAIQYENRSGWWVDINAQSLADTLREATHLTDEERLQMGVNGRVLVASKYRWESIAQKMEQMYTETLGKTQKS